MSLEALEKEIGTPDTWKQTDGLSKLEAEIGTPDTWKNSGTSPQASSSLGISDIVNPGTAAIKLLGNEAMAKKLDDLQHGAYLGVLDMTGDIARLGAKGIDKVAGTQLEKKFKGYMSDQEKRYEQSGAGTGVARFAGAAAVPLGTVTRGAGLLANAGKGALTGATAGATSYKPNAESASDYLIPMGLGAGLGGVFGAAGGAVSSLVSPFSKAKDFSMAKTNNEVRVLAKDMGDGLFSELPTIGEEAQRYAQKGEIKDFVSKVVKSIAKDSKGELGSKELSENMAKGALDFSKRLSARESKHYEPFTKLGNDMVVDGGLAELNSMSSRYTDYIGGKFKTDITRYIDKAQNGIEGKTPQPISFNDIKDLRTTLRRQRDNTYGGDNASALFREAADDMYKNLTTMMQDSADKAGLLKEFTRANKYSAMKNELLENGGKSLTSALNNEHNTLQFVNSFFKSTKTTGEIKDSIAGMSIPERRKLGGAVLNQALQQSLNTSGNLSIPKFLKATQNLPDFKPLLGSETYKRLQGVQVIAEAALKSQEKLGPAFSSGTAWATTSKFLGKVMTGNHGLGKLLSKVGAMPRDSKMLPFFSKQVEQKAAQMGVFIAQDAEGYKLDLKDQE